MRATPFLLSLTLLLALPAAAQERSRSLHHNYAFDPDGVIELTTYKGTITVEMWDRPEVEIDVEIEAEDIDGLVMLPDVEIDIGGTEYALLIETDYRKALHRLKQLFSDAETPRLPLVHYHLRMPRTAHLKIEDYMSATHVTNFQANLDVYTYKGSVDVQNFGGALTLDTFYGTAHVSFTSLSRDSSIGSHQGEVDVQLPPDAAFDLDVDLGDPKGLFLPDTSFAELQRTNLVYRRSTDSSKAYLGPVNGGGPRLNLATHTGALRLATQ